MSIVTMHHNNPKATGGPTVAEVPMDSVQAYREAGWFEIQDQTPQKQEPTASTQPPANEGQQGQPGAQPPTNPEPSRRKTLTQMNTAELEAYAVELGLEFSKDVNTNPERVAAIKAHLEETKNG